ncbi:hypothetical protein PQR28_33690, partial [Paraburkholderia sediminicola]
QPTCLVSRITHSIFEIAINLLRLTDEPVAPCAPFAGTQPAFTTYCRASRKRVADATADAVRRCMESGYALQGHRRACWRGRAHSELLAQDALAEWTLRKSTGDYDDLGEALRTEGNLIIETVRRFKGQSAPAIALTEVDFDPADAL